MRRAASCNVRIACALSAALSRTAEQPQAIGGGLDVAGARAPAEQRLERVDLGAQLAGQHGDEGTCASRAVQRRRRFLDVVTQRLEQCRAVAQAVQAIGVHVRGRTTAGR